ncbi:MurR/RpiR family transcriptional regulator [Caldisalinibacter kiritimatiensis]|uniref:Sialic acid utilization regulator, RpiR family n=1 Tax=Caldisalinibacter kiritimatiensis TaxID=1304284 RepID=R1ASG8_9FIRM|nr:MurR/RpiR family transcriptional regulator [Caldisalinibacter kiritimatiensis]EOD00088.1 Sialic acid utilization regulator, RpiR family [Caldisalinibacter kiritimatiensis]
MDKGILTKIKQGFDTFSPSEKKVGQYILENPEETIGLSIMELSKKCNTSEATVIRFCRTLNLKGYQELKLAISIDLTKNKENKRIIHEVIDADDSPEMILAKISAGSIKAIEDTQNVLSTEALEKAIEAIDNARRIYIFSAGASSVVALDAKYKFMRINIPVEMYFDNHMQLTTSVHVTEKDVAIGISNSGKTKDVLQALSIAKNKGATTIGITQYGKSPICNVSDILLFTANVENNFRSGAMASRIAQLNIIDSIFIGVACKRYDEVIEHLKATREVVEDKQF